MLLLKKICVIEPNQTKSWRLQFSGLSYKGIENEV